MDNTNQKKNHLSLAKVILSLIMSIMLWTIVTNAWGYTDIFFHAKSGSLTIYIYDFFSRFVWAVPAIVLLHIYSDDVPTTWKQLFTNKPDTKLLIIFVLLTIIYNFASMFYNHGGFWINPSFSFLKHFPTFVMVAFVEELVYRGWGLNALSAFLSERKANLVSVIFFVLLHLPAYFIQMLFFDTPFPVAAVATQCAFAFVLGLLFGYTYRKGKSLWTPMILHFLGDFLGVLMVG